MFPDKEVFSKTNATRLCRVGRMFIGNVGDLAGCTTFYPFIITAARNSYPINYDISFKSVQFLDMKNVN
jgi:hypothetical protein